MKSQIKYILLLLLFSTGAHAQLQVDIGKDTTFCYSLQDTVQIGGSPTATGGIEPYTYIWSSNFPYYAIIDDTTIANPKIIGCTSNDYTIKLKVRDSVGTVKEDSIIIRSVCIGRTDIIPSHLINQGDTVTMLYNTFSDGVEPYNYNWSPDYNISETNVEHPKVWPDTNVIYRVYVTDSIGCSGGYDDVQIYVNPNGIFSNTINKVESNVSPNPITSNSVISFKSDKEDRLILKIINTNGQVVFSDIYSDETYEIGDVVTKSGVYFYTICNDLEILTSGKLIKN